MKIILESLSCNVVIISQGSRTHSRCKGVEIPHTLQEEYQAIFKDDMMIIQPIKFINKHIPRTARTNTIIIRAQSAQDDIVIDDCVGNIMVKSDIERLSTRGLCDDLVISIKSATSFDFEHTGQPTITISSHICNGKLSLYCPGKVTVSSLQSTDGRVSISQFRCNVSIKLHPSVKHVDAVTRSEADKFSNGSMTIVGKSIDSLNVDQYADSIGLRFKSIDRCHLGTYTPGKIDLRVEGKIGNIDYHFIRHFYGRKVVKRPGEIYVNGTQIKNH